MTKDQINWIQKEYPRECELVIDSLHDMPASYLVREMIKWMPKSEFMKLIYQVEEDNGAE